MTAFEQTFDSAAMDYDKSRPECIFESIHSAINRYGGIMPAYHVMDLE